MPKSEVKPSAKAEVKKKAMPASPVPAAVTEQSACPPGHEWFHPQLYKIHYAIIGGVVSLILVLVGVVYYYAPQTVTTPPPHEVLDDGGFRRLESGAFGDLSSIQGAAAGKGGGNGSAPASAPVADKMSGAMPAQYMTVYKYVYKGEALNQIDWENGLDNRVFKREKLASLGVELAQKTSEYAFGPVDQSKFSNLSLFNVSLLENKEYGYLLNYSIVDNSYSISQNWARWPHPENQCRDEACFSQYRASVSDWPDDATLISVADAFLQEKSLDISAYGDPVVDQNWRRDYDRAEDKTNYYVPDTATVVYPILVNQKKTLDESGNFDGIRVSVKVKDRLVSDVYGITVNNYATSRYDTIKDPAKVLELVAVGGMQFEYYGQLGEGSQVEEVELLDPEIGLIKVWQPDPESISGSMQELYVPGLIFPIKDPKSWKMNVIVPLTKEVFDYRLNQYQQISNPGNGGQPAPMPLVEPKAAQ